MLEEIKREFTLQDFKHFVFNRYSSFLLHTYPQSSPTFPALLVETLLLSLSSISILFQEGLNQYWTGEEVVSVISYCKYLTLPQLYTTPFVDLLIQALTMGILVLYILFFVAFALGWLSKTFKIVMAHFTRVLRIGCIPYFHVVLFNWFCTDCDDLHYITKPLLTIIFIIFFVCISTTLAFHFNPFPSEDNVLVRLHSNLYLYTYWINFVKVLVYQSAGFNLEYVGILFFLDLAKLYFVPGHEQSKVIYLLRVPDLISLLTSALILFVRSNPSFSHGAFNIWILGIIVLLLALILQWFVKFDKNTWKVYDCLNTSERQIVLMAQESMVRDWGQLKQKELFEYITFICFHSNRCTDVNCCIKTEEPKFKSMNLNSLQSHSGEIKRMVISYIRILLRKYSGSSDLVCTQYYMFCNHIGENLETLNILPTLLISQEYVRYVVKERSMSTDPSQERDITAQNYSQSKSDLFCQFNKVINSLKQFLVELKIKKPDLDILMKHGYNAYCQIADLKKLFLKILRSDLFDLRLVEIYLEFVVNVLKEEDSVEYITRVSKNKWLSSSKNLEIADSSLASLHIHPDEDKIFNMNAEAIKILKFHKMDIYDKKVSSFLHPFNPQMSLRDLVDLLIIKNRFCFIKDSTEAMLPVIIGCQTKKENKDTCILNIHSLGRLKEEAFVLIGQDQQFIQSYPPVIIVGKSNVHFDIKEQYHADIANRIQELLDARFINYESKGHMIHASLSETIHPEIMYLRITVKRSLDGFRTQNSIIQRHQSAELQFRPLITFQKRKVGQITMSGQFNLADEDSQEQESVHIDVGELDTVAQQLLLDYHIDYAEGIKSYRLDGDMIYNIELEEDAQEKADAIVQEKFKQLKHEHNYSRNKKILIYYGMILILSLAYIGIHIYTSVSKLDTLKALSTDHPLETILNFETRFQRMFGVLRDAYLSVQYRTDTNWNSQIEQLFNSIQDSEKSLKFSKEPIDFVLLNTSYHSFLDYACNIFITQIYRMGLYNTTQNFLEVNNKSMQYLDPAIERQKQSCLHQLQIQLNNYTMLSLFTIIVHVCTVSLMLWSVIAISNHSRVKKEIQMLAWKLLSDQQIQSIIDRLSTFQVQLILSERNQEVEVYDSVKDTNSYKKREYPKQFSKKNDQKNIFWIIFFVFMLLLGLVIHGYSLLNSISQANEVSNGVTMNYKVASSYIELVKASKYRAKVDNSSVLNLNDIVNDIQRILPQLNYDPQFVDVLNQVLFSDHCDIMRAAIPNITSCANYSLGFQYPHPLDIGYLIDVSALTFEMLNNITNLYVPSGVIGYVYEIGVSVFLDLLTRAKIVRIQKIHTDELGYSMTNMILCSLVGMVIVLVYFSNVTSLRRIELISRLLNQSLGQTKPVEESKQPKNKEAYQRLPSQAKQQ